MKKKVKFLLTTASKNHTVQYSQSPAEFVRASGFLGANWQQLKIDNMKDKIEILKGSTVFTPELRDSAYRKKFVNKMVQDMSNKFNTSIDAYLENLAKHEGQKTPVGELLNMLFGDRPKASDAQVQWVKDNAKFLCKEIYDDRSPNQIVADADSVASALLLHKKTHNCGDPDCELDKILRLFPAS